MNAIVIFDVAPAYATTMKEQLRAVGYYDNWLANQIPYLLPSNAMWKPNWELKQAKADVERIANSLNIPLLRCIALSVSPWEGIQGILGQGHL